LLFKPFSITTLHTPFVIAVVFFTILWIFILSVAHWVQKQKWFNRLIIPVIVVCIFIYFVLATSGMLRPAILESGAVECTVGSDCIRAGYCGEICASVYRPIYTTYSENCQPLTTCSCINYKCTGT
jgi:hypothetical protein